jgi:DNA modification methylase
MAWEREQIGDCMLYRGDAGEILPLLTTQSVDLCLTSPPYDALRAYKGFQWDFTCCANSLIPLLSPGGILVWIVGDATVNGSETGTSFRQALYFRDVCGLRLHDTMICLKENPGGARGSIRGYWQAFDFMFVFANGQLRVFHPLMDRRNKLLGMRHKAGGRRNYDGTIEPGRFRDDQIYGRRSNIWSYGRDTSGAEHPALMPEKLALDHITSWTNVGDSVLDPFAGMFTVGAMCVRTGRRFVGIEIESRYFDLGCQRLEDAVRQGTLFSPVNYDSPRQEILL